MEVLVLGGTRFFGIELVKSLLQKDYSVTIATRGKSPDDFGDCVSRIIVDRNNADSMARAFKNKQYDVVYDNLAYCSDAVKIALDTIHCQKYILVSSTAVYNLHEKTIETDFDPYHYLIKWGQREDFDYDEGKRQAEAVLTQIYPQQDFVIVRFPVVLGHNDYTERLDFYVKHIYDSKLMLINNINEQLSFVLASDAGKFLAFLADKGHREIYNGSSEGTISLAEIIQYVEQKTNKGYVPANNGDIAPYNSIQSHSICVLKAETFGFYFQPLKQWIFSLIDESILKLENV